METISGPFVPWVELVGGVALGASLLALLVSFILSIVVLIGKTGTKEMNEVSSAIRQGAMAFLLVENACLFGFVIVMYIVISAAISWQSGLCFLVGVAVSALAGFVGMLIATQANVRTTAAARNSLASAMRTAFNGGGVMGLCVTGVGLGGIAVFYMIFGDDAFNDNAYVAAFGLGVQATSLFARVGGGIFTKAADVGADLVGKVETGLPEDDARNPATIADNVGDNVGDVAGMGADLCGSFVGSIICSCLLGQQRFGIAGVGFPMWIASTGIISSIIGHFFVRCRGKANKLEVLLSFRFGLVLTNGLQIGLMALITWLLGIPWIFYLIMIVGLATGLVIAFGTEIFTSPTYPPTRSISNSAGGAGGAASVIIQGLSVGMYSAVIPSIVVAAALIFSSAFGGVYGVALASTGLLSCLAFTMSTDAFGAIADNAGGIAEMCNLPEEVRERTDILDGMGNTTAAIGKGFAIGAALLTGISLTNLFGIRVGLSNLDVIADPYATAGVLIGAMMPYFFSAMTMGAVSDCAQVVITEVRRQLREKPGILNHTEKPNYSRMVSLITASSIHAMIGPGSIALLIPICVGIWFKSSFLGGLLVSNTACGFMLSTMMATSGGAWDNAKKYVESGKHGGKHSEAHKATVVGDTVGDPFKDTSGPSISILIKVSNFTGVVLAPVFKEQAGFWWAAFIIFFGTLALIVPLMISSPSNIIKLKNWVNRRKANGGDNQTVDESAKAQDLELQNLKVGEDSITTTGVIVEMDTADQNDDVEEAKDEPVNLQSTDQNDDEEEVKEESVNQIEDDKSVASTSSD